MKDNESSHTYMRDKKNFYRDLEEVRQASLKLAHEHKIKNEQKYGKYRELISVGENDRINCIKPKVIDDEGKQISYSYGYNERGSRVLDGAFAKSKYTEEEQRNFGIMDTIHGIPQKHIQNLLKYPSYAEGRNYQIGKNAYDYTEEIGITLEEYIVTMGFMMPEVKSQAFKDGYYARQQELEKTKHK